MTDEGGATRRRSRPPTERRSARTNDPARRIEGGDRRRSRRPSSAPQQPASPTGSRQRQRAAERARRKSLRRRRVALTLAIVAVGVALLLGMSRVFGGTEEAGSEQETGVTETSVSQARDDVHLARITETAETVGAVLVSSADPAVMLGFPGATLVRGPTGFASLTELWADDEAAAVAGVADLTGVEPAGMATIEWTSILDALATVGVEAQYPADLAPGAAETGVHLVEALASLGVARDGSALLAGLVAQGDGEAFAEAVRAVLGSQGTVAGLPGREVEGLDYRYFEPDADGVVRLMGGSAPEEAVTVEVQNGSGVVGIAQQVSEVIAPLGYSMLPPKNAEGFPDVEATQINAGTAVVGEADRIRGLLGLGKVVQQDALPPTQIIIVVGKDLDAAALPPPEEGGR